MNFNEDRVPSTVDEAIDMLIATMTDKEKDGFTGVDSSVIHHGFGTYVRNMWSLWETDTPLQRDFIQRFGLFGHADDISSIIISSAQAKIDGRDVVKIQQQLVECIKKHWTTLGLDHRTGRRI